MPGPSFHLAGLKHFLCSTWSQKRRGPSHIYRQKRHGFPVLGAFESIRLDNAGFYFAACFHACLIVTMPANNARQAVRCIRLDTLFYFAACSHSWLTAVRWLDKRDRVRWKVVKFKTRFFHAQMRGTGGAEEVASPRAAPETSEHSIAPDTGQPKTPIRDASVLLESILADSAADSNIFQPLKNSFKKLLQIQRAFKVVMEPPSAISYGPCSSQLTHPQCESHLSHPGDLTWPVFPPRRRVKRTH